MFAPLLSLLSPKVTHPKMLCIQSQPCLKKKKSASNNRASSSTFLMNLEVETELKQRFFEFKRTSTKIGLEEALVLPKKEKVYN